MSLIKSLDKAMRILVHDYAGHAFPAHLSCELASRGLVVTHAFAGNLVTPRGALELRPGDAKGAQVCRRSY